MSKMLEAVRSHPARYIAPNAMTLARPILGWQGMQAARKGDWMAARRRIRQASSTDLEGNLARFLRATSEFGVLADPIADGIERGEVLIGLGSSMNKLALLATLALEGDNLRLNQQVQPRLSNTYVPPGANGEVF